MIWIDDNIKSIKLNFLTLFTINLKDKGTKMKKKKGSRKSLEVIKNRIKKIKKKKTKRRGCGVWVVGVDDHI